MPFEIFLSIGTNIGDKKENILQAYIEIEKYIGKIVSKSSIYKTDPWGNIDQDDFYNSVIKANTQFYPFELLSRIKKIESDLGRITIEKWGPRIIDIDILYFENFHFKTETLEIPHKFIKDRRFVLEPLAEIAPKFLHPNTNFSISDLLGNIPDQTVLQKID